jgi:hypothetical protein
MLHHILASDHNLLLARMLPAAAMNQATPSRRCPASGEDRADELDDLFDGDPEVMRTYWMNAHHDATSSEWKSGRA